MAGDERPCTARITSISVSRETSERKTSKMSGFYLRNERELTSDVRLCPHYMHFRNFVFFNQCSHTETCPLVMRFWFQRTIDNLTATNILE